MEMSLTMPPAETSENAHWYALRTTYGREKRAHDLLTERGVKVFRPLITRVKQVRGKRKRVQESRIPNLLFAYGTETDLKTLVYDNVTFPFLRFYCRHIGRGSAQFQEPLIIPDDQMESFRIICEADEHDIILTSGNVRQFAVGDRVRVVEGPFAGITGRVARYRGQQRVAVLIDGLLTLATTYIPNAFLIRI